MKTKFLTICLLSGLLLGAAGCKKDKDNDSKSFASDKEQPAWTVPAEHEYVTSMTAVVKVNLSEEYPETASDWQLNENDRLAAFAGDVCCGVTAAVDDGLFYLFVCGVENKLSVGDQVELRYYSAHYKNIFVCKAAFEFNNDAHIGSVNEPFVPVLTVAK